MVICMLLHQLMGACIDNASQGKTKVVLVATMVAQVTTVVTWWQSMMVATINTITRNNGSILDLASNCGQWGCSKTDRMVRRVVVISMLLGGALVR